MTPEEIKSMAEVVGKEAAAKIDKEMANVQVTAKAAAEEVLKNGGVTKETFEAFQTAQKTAIEAVTEICRKQGVSLTDLTEKLSKQPAAIKSIAEVLREAEEDLKKVYKNGTGSMEFVVSVNKDGQFVARPFDRLKAAGPHATIDGVGGGSNTASVTTDITDPAAILRMASANAQIHSQFRNTPWIFDLVNLENAGFDTKLAQWWEEIPKQGSSAIVAEGATKPLVQYAYELKVAPYKKEAQLLSFTDEFALDFPRLESEIMGKGRIDLTNRINTTVLANLITAATTYNTAASFALPPVPFANDFDVIAAMAAQVDNATFGNLANAAIMSTFKKYRMGIEKAETGEYLNRPDVLSNISFVGNPAMGADQIVVGDLSKYNVILRGGMIVKVGYNGTDFAENKFSVVMEQFYFDYMAAINAVAIVKGPTFATVREAINAPT